MEELRHSLDITPSQDAATHCLLSDDVSHKTTPWDVPETAQRALRHWWMLVMSGRVPDPSTTDSRYEDLVSKFCGPATEVELRTLGGGVSHTGDLFTRLVLTPAQVDILNTVLPFVVLQGPPGTGKTVMLILKAREWLGKGLDLEVYVVSLHDGGMAAAELIHHQLGGPSTSNLHLYHISRDGEEEVLGALSNAVKHKDIGVVVDEATYALPISLPSVPESWYSLLQMPFRRLWAVYPDRMIFRTEQCLTKLIVREPLRTPPSVTREVEQSEIFLPVSYEYSGAPPPSDGPPVKYIDHPASNKPQEGHNGDNPSDCGQCGLEVARYLTEELCIGQPAECTGAGASSGPATLHFNDVFILSYYDNIAADTSDREIGFVDSLIQARIPIRRVCKGDHEAIADVAKGTGPDQVIVANGTLVCGLERKIVVCLTHFHDQEDRFLLMSRCTSQLVVVRCVYWDPSYAS